MKTQGFEYKVSVLVKFTTEEVSTLIHLAKLHYDSTCVEAGLNCGERHPKVGEARSNGFLVVLRLFPGPRAWTFSECDLTMKILEQRAQLGWGGRADDLHRLAIADKLNTQVRGVMSLIVEEHGRITKGGTE
jgi:hypothetical protein